MNYVFTLDCLSSSWFCLRLRTHLTNQCFTHADVPLSYVNETMSLLGILPLFKIHVNCYMAWDNSPCACCLKMHVVGKGPGAMQSFEPSPFSN